MAAYMTFGESFLQLISTGAGLAVFLFLTLGFLATVILASKKNARNFVAGMIPFIKPRDEKGNVVARTPGQWVGMVILICVVVAIVIL